jgi:hypothetical protein
LSSGRAPSVLRVAQLRRKRPPSSTASRLPTGDACPNPPRDPNLTNRRSCGECGVPTVSPHMRSSARARTERPLSGLSTAVHWGCATSTTGPAHSAGASRCRRRTGPPAGASLQSRRVSDRPHVGGACARDISAASRTSARVTAMRAASRLGLSRASATSAIGHASSTRKMMAFRSAGASRSSAAS